MSKINIKHIYEINAPIEEVWEVLTNTKNYYKWNPFVISAECSGESTQKGTMMNFIVEWHDGSRTKSREEVIDVRPPAKLNDKEDSISATWVYSFRSLLNTIGMIKSIRTQRLSQMPGHPTKYYSEIKLSGWGTALVPIKKIEIGIKAQAEGLINEIEKLKQ